MYSSVGGGATSARKRSCGDGEQRVRKGGAECKSERVTLIEVEEDGRQVDKS